MQKQNCIKFQLLQKVYYGQMVCMELRNCPQYQGMLIPTQCSRQVHDHTWSIVLPFADQSRFKPTDKIFYRYIVTLNGHPEHKIRDVIDEKTLEPMELSFERSLYQGSYVEIFDRCDHQLMNSRLIRSIKMDQAISTTFRLKQNLCEERQLYLFDLCKLKDINPYQLDQYNKTASASAFTKSNQELNSLFRAQMFQKHQLPEGDQIWTFDRLTVKGDSSTERKPFWAAVYESLLYDRTDKLWWFNSNNERMERNIEADEAIKGDVVDDISTSLQYLESKNIKYQVIETNPNNEEKLVVYTNAKQGQFPGDTKFIYEISKKDIPEMESIFTVYLVTRDKGTHKMIGRNKKNPSVWEVNVGLYLNQLRGLEYFFEINILDKEEKIEENSQSDDLTWNRFSMRTHPERVGNNLRKKSMIQIYSNAPATFKTLYCLSLRYNQSHHRNSDGTSSGYDNSYNTHFISYQAIPSTISYLSSDHTGKNKTKKSKKGSQKHPQKKRDIQEVATVISHPNTEVTKKPKNVVVRPTIITDQTRVQQAPKIILRQLYSNSIINQMRDQPQVVEYVKKIQKLDQFSQEVDCLTEKFQDLSAIDISTTAGQQKVKNTIFIEEYKPIDLELKQIVKQEGIVNNFKQLITNTNPVVSSIRPYFQEIHQLQNRQKQTFTDITMNQVLILAINMIVEAKLWGKERYLSLNRITRLLKNYLPEVNAQSQTRIANIIHYLNDHVHNVQKYTYKVDHCAPGNCQGSMQDKLVIDVGRVRQGKEKPFEFVQNDKLYKLLVFMVDCDIKGFISFAKSHNLPIQSDEVSQNLMRVLINYAIVYSIGAYYDNKMVIFDTCHCAELGPFCEQSDQRFLSQDLIRIRDKYVQVNKLNHQIKQTTGQKVVTLQNLILNLFEGQSEDVSKPIVQLISIEKDVQKLQDYYLGNTQRKEFLMDVNVHNLYLKDLKDIDDENDQKQRCVKAKNLQNHQYVKFFASFN